MHYKAAYKIKGVLPQQEPPVSWMPRTLAAAERGVSVTAGSNFKHWQWSQTP